MKSQYYLSLTIILIGGILGNILRFTGRLPDRVADFSQIPNEFASYRGSELKLDAATMDVLRADISTYRDYDAGNHARAALFIAYFKSQKYGSQIHSPKHCLPGGGWRIDNIAPYNLKLPDGTIKEINYVIISNRDYKSIMLYWYETRGGAIRNEYGLKFDLVKNALLFRSTDAAIVRLTINVPDGDVKKSLELGKDFLQKFTPFISKSLPF
jgi:EpsI family protein